KNAAVRHWLLFSVFGWSNLPLIRHEPHLNPQPITAMLVLAAFGQNVDAFCLPLGAAKGMIEDKPLRFVHLFDRCDRLGNECQPAQKIRKRNIDLAASRLSAVEAKLGSLISALQGQNLNIAPSARKSVFATLRDTIPQKLFVERSPTLDLLLGIMTFMAWCENLLPEAILEPI
ncbi:hypothetical protein N7468_010273, partial [Penicillium chermesinum]